jgi:hypothetical protein
MSQPPQIPQLVLLERIADALRALPQVRAAALRSPLSSSQPDAYAFVDLFVVAAEAEPEALLALGRKTVQAAGPVQWLSLLSPQPPRLRALVEGPFRIDLTVVTPATVPAYTGWRVLFDHDNLLRDRTRQGVQADTLRPEHVAELCDAFWWQLFSSVGQLKHGQLWQAQHQLNSCRDTLAQIMRWRRDPERPFEQYMNLERYLTPEDQQALVQTLVGYDVRSIAAGLLHAADAFEPAAREVAARLGATYPAPLAHATKEFFIREFWALIAPGPTISA